MTVELFPPSGGYIVCTSTTRPPIKDGQMIYETDTDLLLIHDGTVWRRAYFKTCWGVVASQLLTADSIGYTASGNTDMVLSGVSVRGDRNYKVHLGAHLTISAAAVWTVRLNIDAVEMGRFTVVNEFFAGGEYHSADLLYQPPANATVELRVYVVESSGTATFTFKGASTNPRQFWIEDFGPRVP